MLQLNPLAEENKEWFILALQQSFRQAVADELPDDEEIISREDIAQSMNAPTAHCLQA